MKSIILKVFVVILLPSLVLGQWLKTNLPDSIQVNCFAVSGTNLFAGTNGDGIFLSSDNGTSWTAVNEGLTNWNVISLAVSGTNLFVATWGGGVFLSADNGTSWTAVNEGLTNWNVISLTVSGTNLFVATSGGGVFFSSDSGTSWTAINGNLSSLYPSSLAVIGTHLFVAFTKTDLTDIIYCSTDNGTNWTFVYRSAEIKAFAIIDTNLFFGTRNDVIVTTDYGTSWTTLLSDISVGSFTVVGTYLFAGAWYHGVFLSTNNWASWAAVNEGLTDTCISCLAVSWTNLFASTWNGGGVWRRPLSEMVTAIEKPLTNLPTNFNLKQNYPNPFNPSTTIEFDIPTSGFVSLKVFNITGQEVTTLINKELSSGTHKVEWKPENLSSGIYYYKLKTKGYQETKKLVFMK